MSEAWKSPAQKPHPDSLASPWSSQVQGPRSLPPRSAGCRWPSRQSPGQSGTRRGHRVSRLELPGHLSASLFLTCRSATWLSVSLHGSLNFDPRWGRGCLPFLLPEVTVNSKTQEITFSESTGNTALKSSFRKPPPPPTSQAGALQRDALPDLPAPTPLLWGRPCTRRRLLDSSLSCP